MKRIIVCLAAAVGVSLGCGTAMADPGGFVPPNGNGGGFPSMAQIAGPNTLLGYGDTPGKVPDRYGLHPCLKKLFHVPTANMGPGYSGYATTHNPLSNPANWGAGGYGMGGPAYNPAGFPPGAGPGGPGGVPPGYGPGGYGGVPPGYGMGMPPGANPAPMQGTLVFPYNNFMRSPRDYFMMDVNNR